MTTVVSNATIRALPGCPGLILVFIGAGSTGLFLANHDFCGLHALGVRPLPEDASRANPGELDQLALIFVRSRNRLVGSVGHVALIHIPVERIELRQEHWVCTALAPGQFLAGRIVSI